jgi:hypothetical protein
MATRIQELNDMLAGRTIASVEAGSTYGWMLLNLSPVPEDNGCRVFMTIRLDTEYHESDPDADQFIDSHYSSAAIHWQVPKGVGMVYMIRPIPTGVEDCDWMSAESV